MGWWTAINKLEVFIRIPSLCSDNDSTCGKNQVTIDFWIGCRNMPHVVGPVVWMLRKMRIQPMRFAWVDTVVFLNADVTVTVIAYWLQSAPLFRFSSISLQKHAKFAELRILEIVRLAILRPSLWRSRPSQTWSHGPLFWLEIQVSRFGSCLNHGQTLRVWCRSYSAIQRHWLQRRAMGAVYALTSSTTWPQGAFAIAKCICHRQWTQKIVYWPWRLRLLETKCAIKRNSVVTGRLMGQYCFARWRLLFVVGRRRLWRRMSGSAKASWLAALHSG